MKIIDVGPKPPKGNSLKAILYRFQKALEDAFGLNQEIKAQDSLITQLGKGLNNRFTLVRNFRIEEQDIPIPLILVGPTGLFVIHTSSVKGVFQAKNESWSIASKGSKYTPSRPNLITRTSLMTRAVETFLKKQNQNVSDIQGVLYFLNPGTHVDAQRPAVRVVLMDGVERFVTGILQGELHYEREDVQALIDAFTGMSRPQKVEQPSLEESAGVKKVSKTAEQQQNPLLAKNIELVSRRFPITTQQWILLAIMAFVEVVILVAFIIIVLTTS
jgi:hypothetical protein